MKHRIRKFTVYLLAPFITMLLTLMKVPDLYNRLKSMHPDVGIWFDYFVIFGTAFIYYHTLWSPLKLFEKQARKRWEVMKEMAATFNEDFDRKFDFNFNVMLVEHGICYHIEPASENSRFSWLSRNGRQFSFYGKILKVVWDHGNSGTPPDFRMTINQGVCGKAFQEANETSKANIREEFMLQESLDENRFRLNDKQKKVVKDVIIAASCPLVITDKDIGGIKKKVIGVLNVESRSAASIELFEESSLKEKFYEKIVIFAKIYLNLH